MPTTLCMHVLLHFYCTLYIDPTLLHTSFQNNKLQHLFTTLLQNMCQQLIWPLMPQIWHMPHLLNMHLCGKCASIYAIYKVALTDDVAKITVHRRG